VSAYLRIDGFAINYMVVWLCQPEFLAGGTEAKVSRARDLRLAFDLTLAPRSFPHRAAWRDAQ
jgi:hypothetical protein